MALDGVLKCGLASDVDVMVRVALGQRSRPGVVGGLRETPQGGLAEQAAGERADVPRADPEHDPDVREHLRGAQ